MKDARLSGIPAHGINDNWDLNSPWVEFNMVVKAVGGTNPTKGSPIAFERAQCRRVGPNLEISYSFRQSGGGGAGSGIYLFQLPFNLTASDTAVQVIGSAANPEPSGNATVFNGSASYWGFATLYNESAVSMYVGNATTALQAVGAGFLSYNLTADLRYGFKASVPIKGWELE